MQFLCSRLHSLLQEVLRFFERGFRLFALSDIIEIEIDVLVLNRCDQDFVSAATETHFDCRSLTSRGNLRKLRGDGVTESNPKGFQEFFRGRVCEVNDSAAFKTEHRSRIFRGQATDKFKLPLGL